MLHRTADASNMVQAQSRCPPHLLSTLTHKPPHSVMPTRQEFLAGVISGAKRALKGLMDASERMYGENDGKPKKVKSTDRPFARPPGSDPDKHEGGH